MRRRGPVIARVEGRAPGGHLSHRVCSGRRRGRHAPIQCRPPTGAGQEELANYLRSLRERRWGWLFRSAGRKCSQRGASVKRGHARWFEDRIHVRMTDVTDISDINLITEVKKM